MADKTKDDALDDCCKVCLHLQFRPYEFIQCEIDRTKRSGEAGCRICSTLCAGIRKLEIDGANGLFHSRRVPSPLLSEQSRLLSDESFVISRSDIDFRGTIQGTIHMRIETNIGKRKLEFYTDMGKHTHFIVRLPLSEQCRS